MYNSTEIHLKFNLRFIIVAVFVYSRQQETSSVSPDINERRDRGSGERRYREEEEEERKAVR